MTTAAPLLELQDERERRLGAKIRRELGPELRAALHDDEIVEIMLNDDGVVWLDRLGSGMEQASFDVSREQAENLLGTVASLLGTVVNEEHPILEGELPYDGSRFEGVVPPVSRRPVFAIRKRAALVFTLDEYVERRQLSCEHYEAICGAIERHENILVCGGTGSGKTTFANAVLAEKVRRGDPHQRIVILEDTVELRCTAPNTLQLRTSDEADLPRLIRATLRLRPDAIVVGEVRGREALGLLKAWNTGHPGGVSTVHANNAIAALSRIDQLVQEAGVPSQPELLAESVHAIVCIARIPGGRDVTEVVRVEGFDRATQQWRLSPIESKSRRKSR